VLFAYKTHRVVVANRYDGITDTTHIFRTYTHSSHLTKIQVANPGPAHRHEIWKVARATSAAPTYFDPIQIHDTIHIRGSFQTRNFDYSDGGVGNNNPAELLLDEVTAKAGTERINEAVNALVSIGTGQEPSKRERVIYGYRYLGLNKIKAVRELGKLIKNFKSIATGVDDTHRSVQRAFTQAGNDHYYRWTGGEEVGGLKLDTWHIESKGHNQRPPN